MEMTSRLRSNSLDTKRRRLNNARYFEHDGTQSIYSVSPSPNLWKEEETKVKRLSRIGLPDFTFPKSHYDGFQPVVPEKSEQEVHTLLLSKSLPDELGDDSEDDGIYLPLSNFSIYRTPGRRQAGCMVPLSQLSTRQDTLLFDGVVTVEDHRYFLRGIRFETLSIDAYDLDLVSVHNRVYLQTRHAKRHDIWYHLQAPAQEYTRYHSEFLWLADFAKHFVCYLREHKSVRLIDFRRTFNTWLLQQYGHMRFFYPWYQVCQSKDFRRYVANHADYLFNEATNAAIDPDGKIRSQPIWKQVLPNSLQAIRPRSDLEEPKTIVTPYVYRCFENFYFADQLLPKSPSDKAMRSIDDRIAKVKYELPTCQAGISTTSSDQNNSKVRVGSIVGVGRDAEGEWKDDAETWYGYVHDVEEKADGSRILHLLWLYRPSDTICSNMLYPWPNELFFSDHCNCRCNAKEKIDASDIVEFPKVTMFSDPIKEEQGYFVRQTYITEDAVNTFLTLDRSHLVCGHRTPDGRDAWNCSELKYLPHDTVLASLPFSDTLEPIEILDVSDVKNVLVRRFLRKSRDCHLPAKENELINANIFLTISMAKIKRRCHIRPYSHLLSELDSEFNVYGLEGTADCWIVTGNLSADGVVSTLENTGSTTFRRGFDPTSTQTTSNPPLNVLDLFCGSGSFCAGMGMAGIMHPRWAVDIDANAIHTKLANQSEQTNEVLCLESAIDFFAKALRGRYSNSVPRPGDVDLIVAGSPCPGFSYLQKDTNSVSSKKNASMVALVAAYVDFYRPKYAILENVFGLTRLLGPNKDQRVFAEIICAFVGIGYQCQVFQIDACNYGSCQQRSRIFISIAAPGLKPLAPPAHTHSTPDTFKERNLGKTINGLAYGSRRWPKTPFKFVSAEAAIGSLPNIGDGAVGICAYNPDQRIVGFLGSTKKTIMDMVPRNRRGMGFTSAVDAGYIPRAIIDMMNKVDKSKYMSRWKDNSSYMRIDARGLVPTIIGSAEPSDIRNGKIVHWEQPRQLTIAEAKRAQSMPDEMVLIGSQRQQWKLVGNAVDFKVAASFGVKLREAWLESDESNIPPDFLRPSSELPKTSANELASNESETRPNDTPITLNGYDFDWGHECIVVVSNCGEQRAQTTSIRT